MQAMHARNLIGIGLYTPGEAERLIHVPARKIARWLRGHVAGGRRYEALWQPQIDLQDDQVYLGFRDLMEMRTAHAFMVQGVSAQKIRRAAERARELMGIDHPLSTNRFKTDGQRIFLEVARENGGDAELLDLFSKQYAFKRIIASSLKDIDFDDGVTPSRWWPLGKAKGILVDPARAFGRPIDAGSGVPTGILANAALAEGGEERAARVWSVPPVAVRRAIEFERGSVAAAA